MQTITTSTGAKHVVNWCGVSTLDGMLYFDMIDSRAPAEIVSEFSDANALARITYSDGVGRLLYVGFNRTALFSRGGDGCVRMGLAKGDA